MTMHELRAFNIELGVRVVRALRDENCIVFIEVNR